MPSQLPYKFFLMILNDFLHNSNASIMGVYFYFYFTPPSYVGLFVQITHCYSIPVYLI